MAAKKVGVLVKEARTAAGLTQEKLAKAAGENLTAADISKCERGEADLTAAQLKKIAVACGVTQASLVNAPKNLNASAAKKTAASGTAAAKKASASKTSASKTSTSAKTSAAKTSTAAKTSAAAKTSTASKKTSAATTSAEKKTGTAASKKAAAAVPASANVSLKVTAAEQKLIQAYRGATSDRKKAALKLLNGDYGDTVDKILSVTQGTAAASSSSSSGPDLLGDVLGGLLGNLFGGK